jgi:hypothetical protein
MIQEIKLNTVSNKLPTINKKSPPRSINPDLTPCYFSACFVGAKNSGKSYGLCTFIKNYQDNPIKDHDGNSLQTRIILFAPTANSDANPVYKTLKNLDEDDIILQYSDDILLDKIESIKQDKEDIEDYRHYLKVWKKFMKIDENINLLLPDELLILSKFDFREPKDIPKPKYNHPPVVFMILDDLIGNNDVFKRNNSLIGNITIRHRHLGINLIFTTQNPKSIPNIVRNNIDIWFLYKFANIKMVLEKIYEEVSNIITEDEFEELYKHATLEPYNALVIDTHPQTDKDKRLRKNFDTILTIV